MRRFNFTMLDHDPTTIRTLDHTRLDWRSNCIHAALLIVSADFHLVVFISSAAPAIIYDLLIFFVSSFHRQPEPFLAPPSEHTVSGSNGLRSWYFYSSTLNGLTTRNHFSHRDARHRTFGTWAVLMSIRHLIFFQIILQEWEIVKEIWR